MKKSPRIAVYVENWGVGGIETHTIALCNALIQRGCVIVVFAVQQSSSVLEGSLSDMGVRLLCAIKDESASLIERSTEGPHLWKKFLIEHPMDAVYIQTMNGMGLRYAHIAEKCHVPVRIVHSHNSDVGAGHHAIKIMIHKLTRIYYGNCATRRLACSKASGDHLFTKRNFTVVNNGIDTKRFSYNSELRVKIRNQLDIPPDSFFVGNTSRLAPAKNPLFQLEVFHALLQLHPNSYYLMMMGEGEIERSVESQAAKLGITSRLIRLEPRYDIESIYSAMDAFLFPSRFEGLGIVAIEAMCSGLPVIASKGLPDELLISNQIMSVDLEEPADVWAALLVEAGCSLYSDEDDRRSKRLARAEYVASAGFDSSKTARLLADLVLHDLEE